MNLEFEARSVNYEEALGGDIVQVFFEENPDDDPLEPTSKNVTLSVNYEFPPSRMGIEWCDGSEYDGGAEMQSYKISDSELVLLLENSSTIKVTFSTTAEVFKKVEKLLENELGKPTNA